MSTERAADQSLAIVERIKPILAGQIPEVQGAVLAELLSLWLAGHYQAGDAAIHRLLEFHVEQVMQLVPVNINILKLSRRPA